MTISYALPSVFLMPHSLRRTLTSHPMDDDFLFPNNDEKSLAYSDLSASLDWVAQAFLPTPPSARVPSQVRTYCQPSREQRPPPSPHPHPHPQVRLAPPRRKEALTRLKACVLSSACHPNCPRSVGSVGLNDGLTHGGASSFTTCSERGDLRSVVHLRCPLKSLEESLQRRTTEEWPKLLP